MRVVLFGATGMVGAGALRECLVDPRVASVLTVGRQSAGVVHPKVREAILPDLFDYGAIRSDLAACDACFFCLGVSVAGMTEEAYTRVTFDLTLAAAREIAQASPQVTFCYVSGLGTDGSERRGAMWARVKGRTENALLALPIKAAYMFRPAFIQPLKGVRSKTRWYQAVYDVVGPFYPVVRRLFPRYVTTTVDLGRALIQVAATGYPARILYSPDIHRLALVAAGAG